jgi:hypothetical protein
VAAIYAILAVTLIHSREFQKKDLFKHAALYTGPVDGCAASPRVPGQGQRRDRQAHAFFEPAPRKRPGRSSWAALHSSLKKLRSGRFQPRQIYRCTGAITPAAR